ncbi:MAG TPA: glutaredoxin family protein [Clostridiaceae bacterium]|nr:glutaredoxin family protein [Clostridiaceae bacterium]
MEKKVVIYTSETCPYCDLAKEYFQENDIKYEEKSTMKPEYRKELIGLGVRSVPTIFVDDKYMVGFEVGAFEELYKGENK